MSETMGKKTNQKNGMSPHVFFKMASAAGFGSMRSTYLFGISGYDFPDTRKGSRHSLGVLYRFKETNDSCGHPFSRTEIIMAPGSETYVMVNRESVATYEGISGQIVVLSANDTLKTKAPRISRSAQQIVNPGKHYQILNPLPQQARLIQEYNPYWQADKSFIKNEEKMISGNELWFELHSILNHKDQGVKYKILRRTPTFMELLLRVEPNVKSVLEYYNNTTNYFKVIQGTGIIIIDGEKRVLKEQDQISVKPGSKFQFYNFSSNRWEMSLTAKPGWLQNDSFYLADEKVIPGPDMWFGIRID